MDVGNDSTTGDGGLDEGVELLVTTDGELKVTGGDTLHLKVLAGVSGKLEDLGGEVLKDGGGVDGSCGTDTLATRDGGLKETWGSPDKRGWMGEVSVYSSRRKLVLGSGNDSTIGEKV